MDETHLLQPAVIDAILKEHCSPTGNEPLDLAPIILSGVTNMRRIRARDTRTLLSYECDQGLLLHDRRSGLQHILTWPQIRAMLAARDIDA
jgi:hypothetical protein